MMYKPWIIIIVIVLTCLYVSDVYGTHFRGGVIMVKPTIGGAAKEVKDSCNKLTLQCIKHLQSVHCTCVSLSNHFS